MAKKKNKQFGDYKKYILKDGTKFVARDDSDAELYRMKAEGK